MKPVIYCIEEYEYFNPYGNNPESFDQIDFLIILSCREGTVQLQYHLHDMVNACQKHEPRLYHYLQNLLANMEEFHRSDTWLIRGLEKDGFDMSRLLYVFLDNADMEHIANWIKEHGKNQERSTVEEIQKSMTEDEDEDDYLLDFGQFLSKKMEVIRKVYEAMKEVALGHVPTLNLLETNLMHSFNNSIDTYAMMMVDTAISIWERLEEEEYDEDEDDDDDDDFDEEKIDLFTLKGLRRFYLKYRKDRPVEGCEDSPIFCVEIVEISQEWETRGWNVVRIWYKLTCAEGEWYNDVELEYLIQEAMLYFPDIYADAVKYYEASSSPRPRDPAMLHGLQRKGHDLTPVLASYLANKINFMPRVREEMRRKSLFADYQNSYLAHKEDEEEDIDLEHVEEFRTINFLRDDLVSVGMAVILRELPEFHIRVPKSFLYYMERWAYHDYIDPLNQLHEELESAFELRRGYKREA